MSEKIPVFNLEAEENSKKPKIKPLIKLEDYSESKINDEEIKERRKIIEEAATSVRNEKEYNSNIESIKEKIKNGELITNVEAGLLKAEEFENLEEEMANLLALETNETEQKNEEKTKRETFVSEEISNEALKNFNIKASELKEMEGFGELSEGQQKIVLQNLRQISFGRVQSEAAERASEDSKKRGFLGRLLRSAIGSDKPKITRLEKEKVLEMEKGGVAVHEGSLKQLIKGMKEFGPKAEDKNKINYISKKEFGPLNAAQKEVLEKYNDIAAEYASLPEEYGFDSANRKDKTKYDEITAKYKQAQENILPMLEEFCGGEKEAMLRLNKADLGVKMNQFVTNHLDVEKQLEKIKGDKWWKILSKSAAEKGLYGGIGFISRSLIGAPIAAAGMGAWLSYRRTKEEMRKKETLNRKGFRDESKTAKNFVKADTLASNFDRIIRKIKEENGKPERDEAKLKELRESLAVRIKYTTDKIDKGLVDFGATEARISKTAEEREESKKRGILGNRYFLVSKLSEAMIASNGDVSEQGEMGKRLSSFLNFQEKRISKAEQRHLIIQTLKGAGIAASFAGAGYLIRHFSGQWFGWDKKAVELVGQENTPQEIPRGVPAIEENYPPEKTIIISRGIRAIPEHYPEVESVKKILELKTELPASVAPITEKLADILSGSGVKDSLSKVLNYEVTDSNYKFSGGQHIIKDFYEKGFNLILKTGENGKTMFGVDGPSALGKYNWGGEGKSLFFKANAELNQENLNKAVKFIKKAADTFYKGPSDYTKQGWSE